MYFWGEKEVKRVLSMLEVGCDVKLPVASPVGTIISITLGLLSVLISLKDFYCFI